jgi:hypothetical protein
VRPTNLRDRSADPTFELPARELFEAGRFVSFASSAPGIFDVPLRACHTTDARGRSILVVLFSEHRGTRPLHLWASLDSAASRQWGTVSVAIDDPSFVPQPNLVCVNRMRFGVEVRSMIQNGILGVSASEQFARCVDGESHLLVRLNIPRSAQRVEGQSVGKLTALKDWVEALERKQKTAQITPCVGQHPAEDDDCPICIEPLPALRCSSVVCCVRWQLC